MRHPDLKALVLLAGSTDIDGINYIARKPELPIFTAAAADDEYNSTTLALMQWFSDLSGNPRSRFSGFKDGRHGTEIFGPHPELVRQIVDFFKDTLITSPVDLKTPAMPRRTPAAQFWAMASQPGGAARAAGFFHDARTRDSKAVVIAESPVNLLGYERLQAGDKEEAVRLFQINTEAYPASANAEDSLSDGYLAEGKRELGVAAEEKCLQLLPADMSNADFKAALRKQAEDKIAKLKGEQH